MKWYIVTHVLTLLQCYMFGLKWNVRRWNRCEVSWHWTGKNQHYVSLPQSRRGTLSLMGLPGAFGFSLILLSPPLCLPLVPGQNAACQPDCIEDGQCHLTLIEGPQECRLHYKSPLHKDILHKALWRHSGVSLTSSVPIGQVVHNWWCKLVVYSHLLHLVQQ